MIELISDMSVLPIDANMLNVKIKKRDSTVI